MALQISLHLKVLFQLGFLASLYGIFHKDYSAIVFDAVFIAILIKYAMFCNKIVKYIPLTYCGGGGGHWELRKRHYIPLNILAESYKYMHRSHHEYCPVTNRNEVSSVDLNLVDVFYEIPSRILL